MRDEGLSLVDAIRRGSLERLAPILMTALCAGLALIPLVLAGHQPGNEIQSPIGVLVPVLFARWGQATRPPRRERSPGAQARLGREGPT